MSESKEPEESKGTIEPNLKDGMTGNNATTYPFGTVYGKGTDYFGKYPAEYDKFLQNSLSKFNKIGFNPSEITDADKITAEQETMISLRRLIKSYYNLALIFGSVGVETIVNHIGKIVLNTDDLSSIDKDEAILNLQKKLDKLSSITKDPKMRELFGKASRAIGDIVLIFVEHANEPMMQVGDRATKIGFRMLTIMASQAISTMEDSVKLIPIFGDGYMILQNMIDMSGSAVSVGQGTMRYYSDLANAYTEISDSLGKDEKYSEDKETLRDVLKEIYNEILIKMDEATNQANNDIADYARTLDDEAFQTSEEERRKRAGAVTEEGKGNEKETDTGAGNEKESDAGAGTVTEEGKGNGNVQSGGSIFKKGGNAKTLKNRLGSSNNLTRRKRL